MKISEIYRKAADEVLWDGVGSPWQSEGKAKEEFSCIAIDKAEGTWYSQFVKGQARVFAESFLTNEERSGGVPSELCAFDTQAEQAMRHAWLHLLAYIAEGEGL